MYEYIEPMKNILRHGTPKLATREESGAEMPTIGLPNVHFTFDLARGFPLVTTRRINYKQTFGELRSFLEGATNVEDFKDNGCDFWNPWAKEGGDLGPIYGATWSRFGQLDHVLHSLRNNPGDRRMVVSAWRPDEHYRMALPPCHMMWVVTPYNGRLNLSWIQRSADWPVGVPHNIASYALLSHLLSAWSGLAPGSLDCIFCDAHIYKNQIEKAEDQISRYCVPLPTLELRTSDTDFWDWEADVVEYMPHPPIKYEVTV
jgi:thymidylate synthase